ncbi:MAG TPA: hypothetical protein VFW48_05425 [Solirubrobacterales bacterium]|nr:hypothetical protein [Solirubrobacterales bacterium]
MGGGARPTSGGLRLALLAFFAAGLLLIPAAPASAADFSLTINVVGEGTVECEVEFGPAEPCEDEYPEETEVSLVAEPEIEWEFVDFSGDCGPLDCELVMDENHEVTATFEPVPVTEFTLTIETDGSGTGEVECELQEGPEPCASEYPEGAEVALIAVPDPGSEFVEFSGNCEGLSPCELTMEEDSVVTATFVLVGPSLTVSKAGTGSGTVKCKAGTGPLETCAPAYAEGTELLLVASASSGSQFAGWSGDCTADPCELLVEEEDLAVTATFDLEPTSGGGGTGGGGTGGGTGTKAPPPPGKLSVSGAALFQGGKAVLRISCKGQGPCKGSLKLVAKLKIGKAKAKKVEIGKAPFSLAAGASKTLKVKLAGAARKVLGKAKTVKATVSGAGVIKSTVTIKPTAR